MSERVTETFDSVWTPEEKNFPKVYTVEKVEGKQAKKYHLYENHAELATSIDLKKPCDFIWDWSSTQKRGILNVYKEGSALLPEQEEPASPQPPPRIIAPPKPDKFGEGQREGMCWKEIGALIGNGKIANVFGKENAMEIAKQYRSYLLATLKLTHDGAKLPQWKKEIDKE